MVALIVLAGALLPAVGWGSASAATTVRTDVLVYGGTPGGVVAAVTAARAGARVVLLEPTRHLGGMMSSGLSWTDIHTKATLGGYAKEFFDRVQALEGSSAARYTFQPHTAEAAFRAMLQSTTVDVRYGERIRDRGRAMVDGTRITAITSASGRQYQAAVFIDASYEGDLLAHAGVTYRVGREAIATYDESLAGVREAKVVVSSVGDIDVPFLRSAPKPFGSGDTRVQEANYRMCFSNDPANETAFSPPADYDPADYEIFLAYLAEQQVLRDAAPQLSWLMTIRPLADDKFDANDVGALSTGVPGLDWAWPDLDNASRGALATLHRQYSQGLIWFLSHDRRVPAGVRDTLAGYGLCKDEFTDNGNWPWLLYIREGRRMLGSYVLTQADIQTKRTKKDTIGVASYRVDSHLVSRWVDGQGRLLTEGIIALPYRDWAIPYRAMTPKRTEITNLLVPVAASASHVAQSALRMEPQYMIMGEAAGEAAAMAIRSRAPAGSTAVPGSTDVQDIDVAHLQQRLRARGCYLVNPS